MRNQKNKKENLRKLANEWFLKAKDDELSARDILEDREGAASTVCFLAQQMAEKYLICISLKKWYVFEEMISKKVYYPWQLLHPDDKIIFKRFKKFFDEKLIKKSPIIGASLWIFHYIPFKVPEPKKQPFYAYL